MEGKKGSENTPHGVIKIVDGWRQKFDQKGINIKGFPSTAWSCKGGKRLRICRRWMGKGTGRGGNVLCGRMLDGGGDNG